MPRQVALSVLGFLDVSAPDFVEAAVTAGFDAVSLRVTGSADGRPGQLLDPAQVAETSRRLDATGLGVIDVEVVRLGPDLDHDDVARAIESAATLGASHLLTVDSGWGEHQALVHQLADVTALAAESGVRACLEFMAFSRCRDLETAVAAAREAGAGVLVDLLHLVRSGGDAEQLAAVVAREGDELFPYVQVCDAPLVASRADLRDEAVLARHLPGQGELPLADLLAALPDAIAWAVEAPTLQLRGLPPAERATRTMDAVRDFLPESFQTPVASVKG